MQSMGYQRHNTLMNSVINSKVWRIKFRNHVNSNTEERRKKLKYKHQIIDKSFIKCKCIRMKVAAEIALKSSCCDSIKKNQHGSFSTNENCTFRNNLQSNQLDITVTSKEVLSYVYSETNAEMMGTA
jgi:hypothetical protein